MSKGCVKRGPIEMVFRRHGGKRPGAARKPKGKRVARPNDALRP